MTDPVFRYVCDQCGNANLEYRAYARWDVKQQSYVIEEIADDDAWCCECEMNVREVRVDLEPLEMAALKLGKFKED